MTETRPLFPPQAAEVLFFGAALVGLALVTANLLRGEPVAWTSVALFAFGILLGRDSRRRRKRSGRG